MKIIHHNRWVKAFTLPEVTLAIGVVALGLVAVFSILLTLIVLTGYS